MFGVDVGSTEGVVTLGSAMLGTLAILRLVLRYERTSVADGRTDREYDRATIEQLRKDLAVAMKRLDECERERVTDRREVARLGDELADLKRELEELRES